MKRTAKIAILTIVGGLTALAGCDKKVTITFTNVTSKQLDVQLIGPGDGTGVIGTLRGLGSRVSTDIEVPKNQLPAPYVWTAGPYTQRFSLTRKSPKNLWFDVGTRRGPRDEKTEIKEHKEETRTTETTEEVITPDE